MFKNQGFTLLELIITISIIGILAAIAVPSYSYVINSNRMSAAQNNMVTGLAFARSEALTKNKEIIMKGKDGNWDSGFEIEDTSGDLIRVSSNEGDFLDIKTDSGDASITFTEDGYLKELNESFSICVDGMDQGFKINIKASGLATFERLECGA